MAVDDTSLEIVRRTQLRLFNLGPPLEAFGSLWTGALDANVVIRLDPSLAV